MPRPKPYRLLTLGVFSAFAVAVGGALVTADPAKFGATGSAGLASPSLLAAAMAHPAEVGYQDTLRAGETLSQLLLRAELAEEEARAVLAGLTEHQDPRRLRPGSVISYRRAYLDGTVRGMEFRLDADRTLNLQREDGTWRGSVEEVPVTVDTVVLTGTVTSSLYAALVNGEGSGIPAEERERVADMLADRIFAWQIDFSRDLRRGDQFRILYERLARPDGTARDGRVVAAQFSVNNRDYEAYAFRAPDGVEGYYDRDRRVAPARVSPRTAGVPPHQLRLLAEPLPSDPEDQPTAPRGRLRGGYGNAGARRGRRGGSARRLVGRVRKPGGARSLPRVFHPLRAPAALRERHAGRRAGEAGRHHRVRGLHRDVHRSTPALRIPRGWSAGGSEFDPLDHG